MKYQGLSAKRRKLLSVLLSAEKGVITTDWAAHTLQWEREKARAFLSSLQRSGWLKLIKPGVYVPVPLASEDSDLTSENTLVLASYLFGEGYIGGWSAASFWGLTDQLFLKTWFLTSQFVRKKEAEYAGHTYLLRHVAPPYLFGLHSEWIGQDKVFISDPHKTVVDFANFIDEYGLQGFVDVFSAYLHSEQKNLQILLDYAHKANNKALFKRLGFMLERLSPQEEEAIALCLKAASPGPTKLAPALPCDVYVKKWRLSVPSHMASLQ